MMKQTLSKSVLLLTVILMDLLSGMEFDLFVPSFPELQAHFHISSFWVETLLSVNFVGYCLSLFCVGLMADRYGRKPILIMGLATFVLGGVFCLWSSSFYGLLLGRFLHGVGIAAPSIISFLIIADSYPLETQQRYMALLNGVMNISVGLSPVIGSYITHFFHWQGNFIVLTLLGLCVLLMTLCFMPNDRTSQKKIDTQQTGYIQLLQSKPLLLLVAHIICMVVPYWIFVGMTPLLYIKALNVSLLHFGYYQGALALIFALGCFIFGWVMTLLEQKTWLLGSLFVFVFSLFAIGITTWINSTSPLLITLSMMIFVIGQIIPSIILYPICLNYNSEAKGKISALIQGGKLLFCAISLQITGYTYHGSFQNIGIAILVVVTTVVITLWMVLQRWQTYKEYP